jgi:hypothetical protein
LITASQTPPPLSTTPAFKQLAMAINPAMPAETASDLMFDFRTTVRTFTVSEIRRALLGTTDGGEVADGFEIPAGEIGRILNDFAGGAA